MWIKNCFHLVVILVVEARNLEAKDANGGIHMSKKYCPKYLQVSSPKPLRLLIQIDNKENHLKLANSKYAL